MKPNIVTKFATYTIWPESSLQP